MADPRASNKQNIDLAKQKEAAVALRAEKRAGKAAEKKEQAEEFKEKGNEYFQRKEYETAAHYYVHAVDKNGTQPTYMSNMAAALLKLEDFEGAEDAAHTALLHEPKSLKARYRRGLARKGQNLLHAAILDFETVIAQDPTNADALSQLAITRDLYESGEGNETGYDTEEEEFPPLDADKWEIETESDSSDYQHDGNGVPCRFYNRDGCTKGNGPLGCRFKHSPDDNSMRDKLGRNVCLYFAIGICKFGAEKCHYAHDLTYLDEKKFIREDQKAAVLEFVLRAKDAKRTLRGMGYRKPTVGGKIANGFQNGSHKRQNPRVHNNGNSSSGQTRTDGRTRGNGGRGRDGGRGKGNRAGHLSARQEREMEERMMNGGFTDDEVNELLCQGVKPWDDDAWDVLHALNDYY